MLGMPEAEWEEVGKEQEEETSAQHDLEHSQSLFFV